jgi:GWxTD domain-containing protein
VLRYTGPGVAAAVLLVLLLPIHPRPARPASPPDSTARVEQLRREVRDDRRNLEARRALARLLGATGDVEDRREAAELLDQAVLIDDRDADLWIQLARLQERRGFRRAARIAFGKAIALAPDRADIRGELAEHELRRFERFHRPPLLDEAARQNERALTLAPGDTTVLRREMRIAAIQGRDGSLDSLCARLETETPQSPWPHLVRGMLFTKAGAWTRARESYDAAFDLMSETERKPFWSLASVDPRAEEERRAAPDTVRYWRDFWRWHDPTPADDENPMLLDHYRRMVLAELLFGRPELGMPGWDAAPGRTLVRYGVPSDWTYLTDVRRGGDVRVNSWLAVPSLDIRYGQDGSTLLFTFLDYNLNGRFLNPISGAPSNLDLFTAQVPSMYRAPFPSPERDQEIEIWRFLDPATGRGRIEVAAAISPDDWPPGVLDEPHRLASRIALYDSSWVRRDAAVGSWALFQKDDLGRLVGLFRLDASPESLIVGMETRDRLEAGRADGYATLPPDTVRSRPSLSDLAFFSEVGFDPGEGGYPWAYGNALPDPGHLYPVGRPIGIGFEAYGLEQDPGGDHSVRIRITVGRKTERGWLRVLLPFGGSSPEGEMVFEDSGPGPVLTQLLSVDLPPLAPGSYLLRVEIEDLLGARVVERSGPFTVVEGERAR